MKKLLLVLVLLSQWGLSMLAQEKSALVIIDVQTNFTDLLKEDRSLKYLEEVNKAIAAHRPGEVIFITANVQVLSISLKGIKVIQGENLELDPRLYRKKKDKVWMKKEGSAFSVPELNRYLDSLGITHVKIAGLYAEECVSASVRDAIKKGYRVSLEEDAIACKKERKREEVMGGLRSLGAEVKESEE